MSRTALLVMAYGTPAQPQDIEAYYTHIRRGRAPSAEQLADLRRRYDAIGGQSPLLELTLQQVRAIERALTDAGHRDIEVALGMKHAAPFIEDAVAELAASGTTEIVGVVLAPHYSRMSVGDYAARMKAAAALADGAPGATAVRSWHLAEGYLDFLAAALAEALDERALRQVDAPHVLFTAHSLPARILTDGDPYPAQLRETAEAVADRLGLANWSIAWQSAGRTPEPWIGPDVLESISDLAAAGCPGVVVCPAGFVSDHLEVLYDLDIEARDRARELGIAFTRTRSPNADMRVMRAIADAAMQRIFDHSPSA